MCGCLRDALKHLLKKKCESYSFCTTSLLLLIEPLCSSRIFLSAHTVSSIEAVLFGTRTQQLRKCLLIPRKSATIFTALILETNLYLQNQRVWRARVGHSYTCFMTDKVIFILSVSICKILSRKYPWILC